jgi:hypothetical protein
MDELKSPDLPIATDPITRQEFMRVIRQFRGDPYFSKLPLPDFAYEELPEYRDTEKSRIRENLDYHKQQLLAKTEDERINNARERLRKKLEAKNRTTK